MIFLYGSRLTSKSESYKHESAPSTTNNLKSTVSFVSGSNISSSDKNNPIMKNEAVPAQPLRFRRTEVVAAASNKKLPLFGRANGQPNDVITPNAIHLAAASSFIESRCAENEEFKTHPAYPCYECFNGQWMHRNNIPWRSKNGCQLWEEVEHPYLGLTCEEYDPFDLTGCEKCIDGEVFNKCSSCEKCFNDEGFEECKDNCPFGYGCLDGKCTNRCVDSTDCNFLDCEYCDEYEDACVSSCSDVEVCNGLGKCISPCVPACTGCDECVFRNGVYGCETRESFSCEFGDRVCCKGKLYSVRECWSLDENCTFTNDCPGFCATNKAGCSFCATGCVDDSDCDASNCESCKFLYTESGENKVCLSSCTPEQICDGNGNCVDLPLCNGCQELRIKAGCDKTDPSLPADCMECVDICDELSEEAGLELTCAPDVGNPANVFCQYQPPVIIASIIP